MSDIIIPGQNDKPAAPILNEHGTPKFAKKEKATVDPRLAGKVFVPPIYYWEDVVDGKSVQMTMAFQMFGENWGMSFPIEDENFVKIEMSRKKLWPIVKETLDVLLHHGKDVLDMQGNIMYEKVKELELARWNYDPLWKEKVGAFNALVKIYPITKKKAVELKLLDNEEEL